MLASDTHESSKSDLIGTELEDGEGCWKDNNSQGFASDSHQSDTQEQSLIATEPEDGDRCRKHNNN